MYGAISGQISLLRSQLEDRRFNEETLTILESILVVKDVRSLLEIRSALRGLLRSEVSKVLEEISKKGVDVKLFTVDFFVKAFALTGDVESCLSLKYEALILRETKCKSEHDLQVSYEEWFTFAKDSLDNRFYKVAVKGFDSALLCIQSCCDEDPDLDNSSKQHTIDNIKKLRDLALALAASHSVQTESANYLKRKAISDEQNHGSRLYKRQQVASLMFRTGINIRNTRKLHKRQSLLPSSSGP